MKMTLPCITKRRLRHPLTAGFAGMLFVLFLASATSWAQSVRMKAMPVRVTVPYGVAAPNPITIGSTATNAIQLSITTGSLGGNPVNFSLTGVPAGATAVLTTNSISADGTHTAFVTFSTDATVAQGTHDMAVVASGAADYRLPIPVICSYFWGGDNYTNGVSTNIANAGNWLGGNVPGATDNVVIKDRGGVGALPAPTNMIVSGNFEVGSLRFSQEMDADANRFFNVEILSGATLKVSGSGGFSMLRDLKGLNRRQEISFSGGGTLMVTNDNANFSLLTDFQVNNTLDMQRLDNLYVDVNRIPLGDYRAYPNFFTNGYTGSGSTAGIGGTEVSRFIPLVFLAKTNYVRAAYADPNNYDDLGERNYSLTIGNYSVQGSTTSLRLSLGNSNAFFLDSICFSQALQGGGSHNYNFTAANSTALFRGAGGLNSRMSVFAIGDAASPAAPGNANVRGQVNFANQANTSVDALVDRLWLSVDRTNNNGQMTLQATLVYSNGVFDVNDAYLGYQRSGVNQGAAASTGFAGPEGTVTVNGTGLFKVNRNLHLGYTTAPAPAGTTSAERTFGKVVVGTGTLAVSNVVVGGVTKLTTNSVISLGGGKMFVTNSVGAADGRLAVFSATNNSQITLLGVSVGSTNVFVKKLSIPGGALGSAVFNIPVIGGSPTYPVTIPVISYDSSLPADPALYAGITAGTLPSGVRIQTIVDNTTDKVIEFTFATGAPNLLAWRGYSNNVWSTSGADKNWVTVPGGLVTNFVDGDSVIFDDNAVGSTSISIAGTVIPGQVAATYGLAMTNSTKAYTFSDGTVSGGATLFKAGSGSLTNNTTFVPGLVLSAGSLAGSGSFGASSLGAGSTMTAFTGSFSGGLTATDAAVAVLGTVNGGLNLQAGSLTNNGTINGTMAVGVGAYLTNAGNINVTVPWTVATNATLVNNGSIAQSAAGLNNGLNVDGTLKGSGKIYVASGTIADARVTMRPGSTLVIGNQPNEITTMTIATRIDFLQGSTTTFDVNNDSANNDKIILDEPFASLGKVNFGAGNNPGGTFIVNRIAGPAFNTSTVLNFFDQGSQVPDNNNQALPGFTPAPAPGLAWDTTAILTNLTLKVTGLPVLTNSISIDTNGLASYEFSWGTDRRGWRLERNVDTNSVGIDVTGTNWETVQYTYGGTNVYYPDTNNLDVYYFHNVQSVATTNRGVYFRLTYP